MVFSTSVIRASAVVTIPALRAGRAFGQAPKSCVDELSAVASACYRLNSLQLRALLSRYRPARDEPAIAADLVEGIVRVSAGAAAWHGQ